VGADIVEIFGLIGAAGAYRTARGAHLQFVGSRGAVRVAAFHIELLQRDVYALRIHRFTLRPRVQALQHGLRPFDRVAQTDDLKSVAAAPYLDPSRASI